MKRKVKMSRKILTMLLIVVLTIVMMPPVSAATLSFTPNPGDPSSFTYSYLGYGGYCERRTNSSGAYGGYAYTYTGSSVTKINTEVWYQYKDSNGIQHSVGGSNSTYSKTSCATSIYISNSTCVFVAGCHRIYSSSNFTAQTYRAYL